MKKTHDQTTSIVACHHRHWKKTTIKLRRAWYAIIALGQHTRSNDVEHGVPSSFLDNTHGHTTSGKACHLHPITACTVKRRSAWHVHMGLGKHKLSDDVGRDMLHRPWATHTVRLCWSCHACPIHGQRTQSNDIEFCTPSQPLGSTQNRMTLAVAFIHRPWEAQPVKQHCVWHARMGLR